MKHQANSFAISMPSSGPAETRNAKKLCVSDASLVHTLGKSCPWTSPPANRQNRARAPIAPPIGAN